MKIFCKEDFFYHIFLIFRKNEWYSIDSYKSSSYKSSTTEKFVIRNSEGDTVWYLTDDYEKEQLLEYFYTEKEYRKLKLDKINENN